VGRDEVILLDTQVAVWITTENPALGKLSRTLLQQAFESDRVVVSAISFWELAMLTAKRRLGSITSPSQHRATILSSAIQEVPLTGDIGILAAELDLHGDPADRFIVATAIVHGATLLTADKALLRWKNKLARLNATK
jgi:PIN domain nuclease of toxin-antitoxin system